MKKKKLAPLEAEIIEETKVRIPAWLYPSTLDAIDRGMERSNCKNRSEYLERAVQFYAGYLSGQDARRYLPPALVSAIQGTIRDTENRLARLLFKLAVEVDLMMHVLAAAVEIDREFLREQRGKSIQNVKKTSGYITFDDVVDVQSE